MHAILARLGPATLRLPEASCSHPHYGFINAHSVSRTGTSVRVESMGFNKIRRTAASVSVSVSASASASSASASSSASAILAVLTASTSASSILAVLAAIQCPPEFKIEPESTRNFATAEAIWNTIDTWRLLSEARQKPIEAEVDSVEVAVEELMRALNLFVFPALISAFSRMLDLAEEESDQWTIQVVGDSVEEANRLITFYDAAREIRWTRLANPQQSGGTNAVRSRREIFELSRGAIQNTLDYARFLREDELRERPPQGRDNIEVAVDDFIMMLALFVYPAMISLLSRILERAEEKMDLASTQAIIVAVKLAHYLFFLRSAAIQIRSARMTTNRQQSSGATATPSGRERSPDASGCDMID